MHLTYGLIKFFLMLLNLRFTNESWRLNRLLTGSLP